MDAAAPASAEFLMWLAEAMVWMIAARSSGVIEVPCCSSAVMMVAASASGGPTSGIIETGAANLATMGAAFSMPLMMCLPIFSKSVRKFAKVIWGNSSTGGDTITP